MMQLGRFSGVRWLSVAALLAICLAGGRSQGSSLTPTVPSTAGAAALPVVEAPGPVEPEPGGVVRLGDGTEIRLPPQSLSARATVTLRSLDAPPPAPVPRSLFGPAYELSLEGGELTGVGLLRIPLPADVTSEQYDVAPYRWNGNAWERVNGRLAEGAMQFGASEPGIFSVQGTWRHADATLALVAAETRPAQLKSPLTVVGQYRYSALPLVQGEVVQAKLTLKQNVSGGAGYVTGDPALDTSIAEAVLWFKPNPAESEGIIDFSHVFEVAPGDLDVVLGGTTWLYAVLEVEDAIAHTRGLSTGVEYTQKVPIQVVAMELVRPKLATEGKYPLRWHIRLNGQTFLLLEAAETRLSLDDVLARGGLGNYSFTLEAETAGSWIAASNEVTVQLALKPAGTPLPGQELLPSAPMALISPTPTPAPGSDDGRPATPTPTGVGPLPSATPTPTVTVTLPSATATATHQAWADVFSADRSVLAKGECTTLHWQVANALEVFLDGQPVTGQETREICPAENTSYTLRVKRQAGTQELIVTVTVSTRVEPAIEFTADSYQVESGQCTTLRWRVSGVAEVYLNTERVASEASEQVCPTASSTYVLRVEGTSGAVTSRTITIVVSSSNVPESIPENTPEIAPQ